MAMIFCPGCNRLVSEKAYECEYCGVPIKTKKCEYCGLLNKVEREHCNGCGAPLPYGFHIEETQKYVKQENVKNPVIEDSVDIKKQDVNKRKQNDKRISALRLTITLFCIINPIMLLLVFLYEPLAPLAGGYIGFIDGITDLLLVSIGLDGIITADTCFGIAVLLSMCIAFVIEYYIINAIINMRHSHKNK